MKASRNGGAKTGNTKENEEEETGVEGRMKSRMEEIWTKYARVISCIVLLCCVAMVFVVGKKLGLKEVYAPGHFSYRSGTNTVGYIEAGDEGGFSYGPYTNLRKGNYEVTVEYMTDTDMEFDIIFKKGNTGLISTVEKGELPHNQTTSFVRFYRSQDIKNNSLEVRTKYSGEGSFQLYRVILKRQFLFDWYIIPTFVILVLSLVLIYRKNLRFVLQKPKALLYFAGFYMSLACLGLYTLAFLPKIGNIIFQIIACILIPFHAWGGKREIYDKYITFQYLGKILSCFYLALSFYALDMYMRWATVGGTHLYDTSVPNLFSFSIIMSVIFIIILLPKLWLKRLAYGLVYYTFVILLLVQKIYYQVFGKLFSFKDVALAKEGSDYMDYVISFMDFRFVCLVLLLILIGGVGIFLVKKTIKLKWKGGFVVAPILAAIVIYSHTIYAEDFGKWNSFENDNYIYTTMTDRNAAFKLCGFYQYELKDLKRTLFANSGDQEERMEVVADFFEGREKEGGQDINSMTGIFMDKNVIFVLMESIDDIACKEEVMPTLYRMAEEGINFSNMYAPICGTAATANSEMVTNVGLYAPVDGSLVYSFADNYFPYSLAARLTDAGYTAKQFHYNTPSFYSRDLLNSAFGYQEYVSFQGYPQPTLDTTLVKEEGLYNRFVEDVPFFNYIITYTAHLSYNGTNGPAAYAMEQYPEYADMTESEEVNYYFAKARITDDMLGGLLDRLEADGILEDTVVIAIGDHYPYGIEDEDVLYALSDVERYEQLLYKVPCVIWTPGMTPVTVDKLTSSADLVPTVVNLMGLGDVSMYIGCDAFDESYEGYVYFADGSWLMDDAYYFQGKVIYGTAGEEELSKRNQQVMELITVNDNILETDYYLNGE